MEIDSVIESKQFYVSLSLSLSLYTEEPEDLVVVSCPLHVRNYVACFGCCILPLPECQPFFSFMIPLIIEVSAHSERNEIFSSLCSG